MSLTKEDAVNPMLASLYQGGPAAKIIQQRLLQQFPDIGQLELYVNKSGQFTNEEAEEAKTALETADVEKSHFVQTLKDFDAECENREAEHSNRFFGQQPEISRLRAKISQTHNWEEVFQELEKAQHEYNNPRGLGKVRKIFRKVGDNQKAIMPLLDFIPDGDYTSILCGGLKFVLGACAAVKATRVEIFNLIEELPDTIDDTERYLKLYNTDIRLKAATRKLYVKVLLAIGGMIESLKAKGYFQWLKPLFQQGQYRPLGTRIDDVNKSSTALKKTIEMCGHARLDEVHSAVMEHTKVFNLFGQFFVWQIQQTEWIRDGVMDLLKLAHLQGIKSRPEAYISKEDLFAILAPGKGNQKAIEDEAVSQHNETEILRTGRAMNMSSQIRAEYLMTCPKMSNWFQSKHSQALLVNGNSKIERKSPVSFFCAMLTRSLKLLDPILVITHFCGLHLDFHDPLAGSHGLLQNLTAQLVAQWHFGEITCLDRAEVTLLKNESQDQFIRLETLWRIFRTLVVALPRQTPVFIILDGVSFYETHERGHDTKKVISGLCRLIKNPDVSAMIKLLVSSPNRALNITGNFSKEERVLIPENPQGPGLGFSASRFKRDFGGQITALGESAAELKPMNDGDRQQIDFTPVGRYKGD